MEYYHISEQDLGKDAKIPLCKMGSSESVFTAMAKEMLDTIRANNAVDKPTVLICPVGPTGQYPVFVHMVNETYTNLQNCWFFNMDEYLDEHDHYIAKTNPLSFRGFMDREVYGKIQPSLCMRENQRIFPDPSALQDTVRLLEKLGGADLALGGIGINGHLAFNEPQSIVAEDFAQLSVRVLDISEQTRAVNGSGELNGAMELMPRRCVTLGMREILAARKIRLGVFRTWHSGVVRRAAYGACSAEFPVTLCQSHADAKILINDVAARLPV